MPKIFNTESKEEWLKHRAEDITSTEVSALIDLNPYTSEFELYHRKREGDLGEIADNNAMRFGRLMEPVIAQIIKEDHGIEIRRLNVYMRHDDEPRMGSSFDYEIINHADGPGILEIKNVAYDVYKRDWEDGPPPHIELQVQQQLEIVNREWGIVGAFIGFNQIVIYPVKRDREAGANLRALIKSFWKRVDDNDPPSPNFDLDADYIIAMHSRSGEATLDRSDDVYLLGLLTEYAACKETASSNEKRAKGIKAEVFSAVGDDCGKVVLPDGLSLNCKMTSTTEGKLITQEMVGERSGARKGYRQFKISKAKEKK